MKKKHYLLIVMAALIITYFLGPKPAHPVYNTSMPAVPERFLLDSFIKQQESQHHLKQNNQARIIWHIDSSKSQTDYAIVYLHGFSASQEEGAPVHKNIAKAFGCNLYLSRLAEHGIDTTDQLQNLTADNLWESAKQALAIGEKLGKKVILMGTSTGCTLSLMLAATYPDKVAGLILYSPNIKIKNGSAWLLNNPWGLYIARMVMGGKYFDPPDQRPIYKAYWNKPYRLEATVSLQEMLETSMNKSTFEKVKQPVLMLYYYNDESHQDEVVSVDAMKEMFEQLGTPSDKKIAKALAEAGDHVIASPIKSHAVEAVQLETERFMRNIMNMSNNR
jgi:pimeloyl-ACP methyl ester carboxylesterase